MASNLFSPSVLGLKAGSGNTVANQSPTRTTAAFSGTPSFFPSGSGGFPGLQNVAPQASSQAQQRLAFLSDLFGQRTAGFPTPPTLPAQASPTARGRIGTLALGGPRTPLPVGAAGIVSGRGRIAPQASPVSPAPATPFAPFGQFGTPTTVGGTQGGIPESFGGDGFAALMAALSGQLGIERQPTQNVAPDPVLRGGRTRIPTVGGR